MMRELFRNDSYLAECQAKVVAVDAAAVQLDQSVFYPTGGGQPGDHGELVLEDGRVISIIDTRKSRETGEQWHITSDGAELPKVGDRVTARIDWARRYRLMRMHTALHLLCSQVDGGVTGGSVGEQRSRLDFDIPEAPDKVALEARLNALVVENHPVEIGSITDAELDANQELVRTMSVSPPRGLGSVRTIRVSGIDYQPCGGTHVNSTGEIGPLRVGKIEKKGRQNRRIHIHLVEAD